MKESAVMFDEHAARGTYLVHGGVTTTTGPEECDAEAHEDMECARSIS